MYVYVCCAYLCRWRLHGVVVQDDVLQLPELPVGRRNLCDLVAGEIEEDEGQIGQLYRERRGRYDGEEYIIYIYLYIYIYCIYI